MKASRRNNKIPNKAPKESATASINSILRPRKVRMPCNSSMKAPRPVAISNNKNSLRIVVIGLAQSQRKVKPPNITRCTHLSINGTSTFGSSLPGVKQPTKISKVQRIAKDLACFL